MSIFWNLFFWLTLVAITGIIAAVVIKVVSRKAQSREYIADASNGGDYKGLADRSAATNLEVLAKLKKVEERLAAIEQTLTEIP